LYPSIPQNPIPEAMTVKAAKRGTRYAAIGSSARLLDHLVGARPSNRSLPVSALGFPDAIWPCIRPFGKNAKCLLLAHLRQAD